MEIEFERIDKLIIDALREDLGDAGDLTTDSIVPSDLKGEGVLVALEEGVVAGLPVAKRVFRMVDSEIEFVYVIKDGDKVKENTTIGRVQGSLGSILKAERTALNFLQRISGIATTASKFVHAVEGTGAVILDTRKTTPCMRILEKYGVKIGGGRNHRFGLYDMVLIKDNHIDAAGGVREAVERCINNLKKKKIKTKIEVETRNLKEVKEALDLPVDRIMLDNMEIETIREAVRIIDHRVEVEASGNVSLKNVRSIAETGVDYISIGALTHSVKALDISLRISGSKVS